jgi:hypothetical protein
VSGGRGDLDAAAYHPPGPALVVDVVGPVGGREQVDDLCE